MNKTKKRILILIVLFVFLLPAVYFTVTWVVPILLFSHTSLWKHNADFENYESDFCVVKDYVTERFPSETGRIVAVSAAGENGIRFFDYDTMEYADVPDEIKPSLERIKRYGFPDKDAVFTTIRICGDRVAFCIESLTYALVYSPEKKPNWLNAPDEQIRIRVKKAGDGWYHVVAAPGLW